MYVPVVVVILVVMLLANQGGLDLDGAVLGLLGIGLFVAIAVVIAVLVWGDAETQRTMFGILFVLALIIGIPATIHDAIVKHRKSKERKAAEKHRPPTLPGMSR